MRYKIKMLSAAAPFCSYYYMSGAGDPPAPVNIVVDQTPPEEPPTPDHSALIGELRGRLEGMETRLETVAQEAQQWTKSEIQAAIARLDNLEATATTGMENLAEQITQVRQELKDLLTQQLRAQPPEEPQPPEVNPAELPGSAPPDSGDGTQPPASAPSASQSEPVPGNSSAPAKRKNRVI